MELNPLTLARRGFEWLAQPPTYQWTLTNNPLRGKDTNGQAKSFMTAKLCRGARLFERCLFVGFGLGALLMGPAAFPFLGVTAGKLSLPLMAEVLFNLKANAIVMGWVAHGAIKSGAFLTGMFDQIFNGPDEHREAE